MRRTAFSLALAAEMFVLTGMANAQTTPAQPAQPAQPANPSMPERKMDPADRERMQKEWDSMKKEWEALTPEARILSIIHTKNLEEIELGRLAQEKASAPGVKEYAAMMVRDHTEADGKLTTLAANEKISLWDTARTDRALKLHKMFDKGKDAKDKDKDRDNKDKDKNNGKDKDRDADRMRHNDQPGKPDMKHMDPDKKPAHVLNGLSGADFDAAYVHMMHRGHAELLEILDKKDDKVANANVKSFVSDVTSTVRKHRDEAAKMDTGKDKDGKDKDKDRDRNRNANNPPKEPAVKDPNWDR